MGFVETSDALQHARTKQLAAQSNEVPISKQVGQGILANHRSVDIFLLLPGFTGPTKSLPIGINHVSRTRLISHLKLDLVGMDEIIGIQKLNPATAACPPSPVAGRAGAIVVLTQDAVRKSTSSQSGFRDRKSVV